jgi:nicotinate (nicotinamide) nucleotide adenylyltransferase
MEFLSRASSPACRVAVMPGSFHPVTVAHLAVAEAALASGVDEVLLVMPRAFPHKGYDLVGLNERIGLVRQAVAGQPNLSVAITDGGLFIDIARECRPHYGFDCDLWFLCGRDAAERIINWDYGSEGRFAEQLTEFGLLVAERQGHFHPPPEYAGRIQALALPGDWNDVSATEVRERIEKRLPWQHLVPAAIHVEVERLYGSR